MRTPSHLAEEVEKEKKKEKGNWLRPHRCRGEEEKGTFTLKFQLPIERRKKKKEESLTNPYRWLGEKGGREADSISALLMRKKGRRKKKGKKVNAP